MIERGQVAVPGESGPVVARSPAGAPYEIFDVVDALAARYPKLYVVDLDGIERGDPQLDYLQEIARDCEIWVDAGVRNAEQAIDVLVTGARRAVLTSAALDRSSELERALALSGELLFELAIGPTGPEARDADWRASTPEGIARQVRAVGIPEIIVSARGRPTAWELVRELSGGGPTWVGGDFEITEVGQLEAAGAAGGIFHLEGELLTTPEGSPWSSFALPSPRRQRDDSRTG